MMFPKTAVLMFAAVSPAQGHNLRFVPLRAGEPGAACTLDGPQSQCGIDEFCAADAGKCNLRMAGISGTCKPLRLNCMMSLNPVCGCDMQTYDNADCAQAQGINVSHDGPCMAEEKKVCAPPNPTPGAEACCSGYYKFCYKPYTSICNESPETCASSRCGRGRWITDGMYDCKDYSTSSEDIPDIPDDKVPCLPKQPAPGAENCCSQYWKFCYKPATSVCNEDAETCGSKMCGFGTYISDGVFDCGTSDDMALTD